MNEILDELPRLTHAERRLLCRRALAIDEEETAALQVMETSAAEGFALLDRMEAEDESVFRRCAYWVRKSRATAGRSASLLTA